MKNSDNRPRLSADEICDINKRFVDEAARFKLLYRCEDCVHVLVESLECTLGYPNDVLTSGDHQALDGGGQFVFCKDFEVNDG